MGSIDPKNNLVGSIELDNVLRKSEISLDHIIKKRFSTEQSLILRNKKAIVRKGSF